MALFLIAATVPIRSAPLERLFLGEHRVSETLSIDLRHAEAGYWRGYPDSRTLIDADQRELINRLRDDIASGRLTASTRVLHVAFSFQQWASTPLGVFVGVIETVASQETEVSSHTAGGRLFALGALQGLLRQPFGYVVLEPKDLPAGMHQLISTAGYRPIFSNARGEIFIAIDRH